MAIIKRQPTNCFYLKYNNALEHHASFGDVMLKLLKKKRIVSAKIFAYKTHLPEQHYRDLISDPDKTKSFEIIIIMCVVTEADLDLTEYLLRLNGRAFNPRSKEHQAYKEIIQNYQGKSFHEINAFLVSQGVTPFRTD